MMQRTTFGDQTIATFRFLAALLSLLLGLATGGAPSVSARGPGEGAVLGSATTLVCAVPGDASHREHTRQDENCCCLSSLSRRDAPSLLALLAEAPTFPAPVARVSVAEAAMIARRARAAEPTTPWLSRAPPSLS